MWHHPYNLPVKGAKRESLTSVEMEPKIHWKEFEDNYGALELSIAPIMRPWKKLINIVYHYFWSFFVWFSDNSSYWN